MTVENSNDDELWRYVLATKLLIYIPAVRKWWQGIEDLFISGTGVFPVLGEDVPPGLMYRMTNVAARSPIKHVQAFPFVPVSYLQLTNIAGGANKMITRVCADFTLEEFTIISKSNLPSTYHQGQFIAFVPTTVLTEQTELGRWLYLTQKEQKALIEGRVSSTLKLKLVK